MPTNEQRLAALEAQVASLTDPSHSELTNRMADLLTAWQGRENEMRDWLAGAPNGGPNGDGRYPLSDSTGFTRLVPAPSRLAADAALMQSVDIIVSTVLNASHNGKRLRVGSAGGIVLTLPNGLPRDWSCLVNRVGTGQVTLAAASPATLVNDQNLDRLRARWAVCTVFVDSVSGGNSLYVCSGSMIQSQ